MNDDEQQDEEGEASSSWAQWAGSGRDTALTTQLVANTTAGL